ncbi:MAG: hypothetical protein A2V46_15305 [Bacteroidetes bacterium RBG_19FT_COMBO_42_7]|nr:MAG: hypothetical protein A2Y71_03285 [Bacteroidetes bacterium RBG_13_42_15]OFY82303.1 MAG: hypothetical protein A2V46_15305 [Bacteroidetes bacterium RBG_19FT_COMBO_42_7]
MIINKTCDLIKTRFPDELDRLTITDVTIGLYLTAVRLSDGTIGTSATLKDDSPVCGKHNRDFSAFTPLKINGQKVTDLLETKKESGLISSLKTAVLNAFSSGIIASGNYRIRENCDPVELLELNSRKTVTIIGAFQSYIRKISRTGNKLFVLEMNENALSDDQKKFYVPHEDYGKILPQSDIVIITGQTLVNNTIDDLLAVINPKSEVIVTGPSSGILPDLLFENKVSVIGTIRITKPEILFSLVREGGTGYHLFEYCAQKICILKGDEK